MIVNGIECPKCKDHIWSRHRHDWRLCKCGSVFVDGGRYYLRWGAMKADVPIPKFVEIDTDSEADSEAASEVTGEAKP